MKLSVASNTNLTSNSTSSPSARELPKDKSHPADPAQQIAASKHQGGRTDTAVVIAIFARAVLRFLVDFEECSSQSDREPLEMIRPAVLPWSPQSNAAVLRILGYFLIDGWFFAAPVLSHFFYEAATDQGVSKSKKLRGFLSASFSTVRLACDHFKNKLHFSTDI